MTGDSHFKEANGSQGSLTSSMSHSSLQEKFWQKEEFAKQEKKLSVTAELCHFTRSRKRDPLFKCVGKGRKPDKSPRLKLKLFSLDFKWPMSLNLRTLKRYLVSEISVSKWSVEMETQ